MNVNIALITDDNYVIQTATTITSIFENKALGTHVHIFVVTTDLGYEKEIALTRLSRENFSIYVVRASLSKYAGIHKRLDDVPCVATMAALLKFDLPELLPNLEKVLYLDGDLIVREDLLSVYSTDIEEFFLAAVVDSGSIYYRHKYVRKVKDYFNSGVMLLNLKKMRENKTSELLITEKKQSNDSFLMDQNAFNVVFDKQIQVLPIRYNFLYVSLLRAKDSYTLSDINQRFGTSYASLDEMKEDAVILHYSSREKPWKYMVPSGEEWWKYLSILKECSDFWRALCGQAMVGKIDDLPRLSEIKKTGNSFRTFDISQILSMLHIYGLQGCFEKLLCVVHRRIKKKND